MVQPESSDVRPVQMFDQPKQPVVAANSATLLAYGERVLLQTATVPIQGFDGSYTVSAQVLLDSAS